MIIQRQWDAGYDSLAMLFDAIRLVRKPERKARLYWAALVRRMWSELPWLGRVLTEITEAEVDGAFDPNRLARPLEYIAEGLFLCVGSFRDSPDEFPAYGLAQYERYLAEVGYVKPPDADANAMRVEPGRLYRLTKLVYVAHESWTVERMNDGESWSWGLESWVGTAPAREFGSVSLVRDIFGNPFRPVAFSPSWRTDTAVTLAQQMYESRDFGAMPILADALQDAGCDSEDVLTHCRGDGPHVRGCWVVDLVLGKE